MYSHVPPIGTCVIIVKPEDPRYGEEGVVVSHAHLDREMVGVRLASDPALIQKVGRSYRLRHVEEVTT